jgi:type 1 glutamine amidotransferase
MTGGEYKRLSTILNEITMRHLVIFIFFASMTFPRVACSQQQPAFRALAFYSENVEHDHVDFAHQAIRFYSAIAQRDHFEFATTTNWDDLNAANLARYQLILWLDDFPHSEQQRRAFEQYMTHGGGWLGFHIAAYNDSDTHWPWFLAFLGGGVFYGNNWPPLPAMLTVDDKNHPVAKDIPESFISPANEWYIWKPSPRLNKDVKVILTLSPSNYPIGLKDVVTAGDLPVVWTNTRYRMLYMNMGHGDKIFASDVQNRLFENSILWIGDGKLQAQPESKRNRTTP